MANKKIAATLRVAAMSLTVFAFSLSGGISEPRFPESVDHAPPKNKAANAMIANWLSGKVNAENVKKSPYDNLIAKHARENGVPVKLAHAIIEVESRYKPKARGASGEIGLMQILPRTARGIGYKGSMSALYNPDTNLQWGMKYLGEAHRRGGKTICGTVLKYNAGHYAKRMNKRTSAYCGKVKRILQRSGSA